MAVIPKPAFPNVPQLPGVPQLPRSPQFPAAPTPVLALGLALGRLWQAIFSQPQWAIYKSNPPQAQDTSDAGLGTVTIESDRTAVVKPDSFGEFTFRNEWSVVDVPLQDGEFASYNKVNQPYEIMVRMYKGGTKEARQAFIDSIIAIAGDLQLYDIVTPEKVYLNVNVTRWEQSRRGARGAYFLSEVDLYFREIRTVTAAYTTTAVTTSNAQNPSAEPVTNVGVVQAQPTDVTVEEAEAIP